MLTNAKSVKHRRMRGTLFWTPSEKREQAPTTFKALRSGGKPSRYTYIETVGSKQIGLRFKPNRRSNRNRSGTGDCRQASTFTLFFERLAHNKNTPQFPPKRRLPFNLIAQLNAGDVDYRQRGTACVAEVDRALHFVSGGVPADAVGVRHCAAPVGREGAGSLKVMRCFRRVRDEPARRRDANHAVKYRGGTKRAKCRAVCRRRNYF